MSTLTLTISQFLLYNIFVVNFMYGIDLNDEITFFHASERFFKKDDRHINRIGYCDVLLLVYEGVLRFNIDGEEVEVRSGEYYIQRKGTIQKGTKPSSSPKYFFIHFKANWDNSEYVLPYRGYFSFYELEKYLRNVNSYFGTNNFYIDKLNSFYTILLSLLKNPKNESLASKIMDYLRKNFLEIKSLDELSTHFAYSKNHIINIFKDKYNTTPTSYILELKINNAMYLLEVTSMSIIDISIQSGFNNYSQFYRKFFEFNGMSPEQWRQRIRKTEIISPFEKKA